MKDTAFYVPKEKLSRLALMHGEDQAGKLTADRASRRSGDRRRSAPSAAAACSRRPTDYARFAQMLLNGGELGGARVLAPRTVEMMRTNHVQRRCAEDDARRARGGDMDFQVIMDAAAAGEPCSDRHVQLVGHRRHLVLDRSGEGPRCSSE